MRSISCALFSTLATLCFLINTNTAHTQALPDQADVPHTISFQGFLSEQDGSPVLDGTHSITLTLYSDPSGTNEIWEDTYSTTINNGIFNIYIGGGNTPLPEAGLLNGPLWVGVRLGDGPPMLPLTPFSASPYALNVANGSVTSAKLADGAVTAEKMNVDYVSGIAVNGTPVTGKGTILNLEGSNDIALEYDEVNNTIRLGKASLATRGDNAKEAQTLAVADAVWSLNGDGWDVSAAAAVVPAAGDWIGTSATSGATFEMRTNGQTIMRYQPNGTNTPNIIGGNSSNSITAASIGSTIGGGKLNDIDGDYAVIGGGESNTVSGDHAAVVAGYSNTAQGIRSFVGGGYVNQATGVNAAITGGNSNIASGTNSTIGGGYSNYAEGTESFIGSGTSNIVITGKEHSALAGGWYNSIESSFSFLGGGSLNTVSGDYAVAGGGSQNTASGDYAMIGSGLSNNVSGDYAIAGAGRSNTASGESAVIGGGYSNTASGAQSFIGSGYVNQAIGINSSIGGGNSNSTTGTASAIAGGYSNYAQGSNAFIGAGTSNNVATTASDAGVGSGWYNTANAGYSFVGGGYLNTTGGLYSAIPGGDNLLTTGYAQSAVGFYNDSRGTLMTQPDDITIKTNNDPLFMVGNGVFPSQGGAVMRSNAFEVSYNGHSVVSDNIRTSVALAPGNRTPVVGARYIDNTVYGWGDIGIFGGINSSFGVDNVQHPAAGVYIVTLRLEDKNGAIINLNEAAITATLVTEAEGNPFQCADIKVSRIGVPGPNMFTVWTIGPNCTALNSAFMFHVTGRP